MVDIVFECGPAVKVHLHMEADSVVRVSLERAPRFSVEAPTKNRAVDQLIDWLELYGQSRDTPLFPHSLQTAPFHSKVLDFLPQIPRGTVFSYQQVADAVGHPNAARAVGNCCRTNRYPLFIPCHRVVRADGQMGNYTPTPDLKLRLLQFEGVKNISL